MMRRAAANRQAPEHGNEDDGACNLALDVRAQHTILTALPGRSLETIAISEVADLPDDVLLREGQWRRVP